MDFSGEGKKVRSHNQIVHFDNSTKATLLDVNHVWQDTLVHVRLDNGREYMINPARVLFTEIEWNDRKN